MTGPSMIRAFFLALGQLADPGTRRVLGWGIVGSVVGFVVLALGSAWGLSALAHVGITWIDDLLPAAGALVAFFAAWLFFPAAVITVSGLMIETVVERTEELHHPDAGPTVRIGAVMETTHALRMGLVAVGVNLLALPLYLFLPGLNLFIYYGVNGWLMGRDYFELAAVRHIGIDAARTMRRRFVGRLTFCGILIAVLTSIPVVNLACPVIAAAMMVHVFHDLRRRQVETPLAGGNQPC